MGIDRNSGIGAFQSRTQYTLEASGLMNTLGGPVAVPRVTFMIESFEAPVYSSNIGFSFQDAGGNVQISAPEGSFEPGTIIVIVDQSNGAVLSMTVGNDGSVTGWIPATTSDLMVITVTDPASRVLTFYYGGAASKRVSSIQDSTGVVAAYTYSGQLLTGVIYADNSEIGYRYNSSNLITSVVDGLGKVMEAHTYDSGRRGLTSEKADGV